MKTAPVIAVMLFAAAGVGCAGPLESQEPTASHESTQPIVLPGAQAGGPGPAGTFFLGRPLLVFVGTDGQINTIHQRSDGSWPRPRPLGQYTRGSSNQGAAVIALAGEAYLVWYDLGNMDLCWMKSRDAASWFGKSCVGLNNRDTFYAVGEPALAIHRNEVNILTAFGSYTEHESSWTKLGRIERRLLRGGQMMFLESFAAQTRSTPSAVVLNDQLIAAWNHRDRQSFRTAQFFDGPGWSSPNVIPLAHEGHLIAEVAWPESLIWVYRETGGPEANMIKFDRTTDAVNFHWLRNTDHSSAHRPFGVMASDGLVRFAHIGQDGFRGLNYTEEGL